MEQHKMPIKKYDYDINKIQSLQNEGLSIRAIARKFKWCEVNTYNWLVRNYNKKITYTKKGR
tara:strand:+ start:263 stop:448 length:186 start_codon:yes stop_codon:yes gene_type:complete